MEKITKDDITTRIVLLELAEKDAENATKELKNEYEKIEDMVGKLWNQTEQAFALYDQSNQTDMSALHASGEEYLNYRFLFSVLPKVYQEKIDLKLLPPNTIDYWVKKEEHN